MLKSPSFVAAALLCAAPVLATDYGLGRLATPDEVAAWNIDVRPDGQGLPIGQGSVIEGEDIYVGNCAMCHGDFGEGVGRWPVLAGGQGSLTSDRPVKTIGSYWPYLSTVWDYVNRAMRFGNARSLSSDDIYAVTAYLLFLNDVIEDEEFVLSNENFTDIRLPNEANFFADDRPTEEPRANGYVCMANCKDSVEITTRAAIVDVTPEETEVKAAQVEVEAEAPVEPAAPAIDPELVAAGERVFKKCKACHRIGEGAKNKTGPALNGVYEQGAGLVDGFKYSKGMVAAGAEGLVWDDATLDAFLTKPKSVVAKTRMSFSGLKKDADRLAIIEYLKSFSQ